MSGILTSLGRDKYLSARGHNIILLYCNIRVRRERYPRPLIGRRQVSECGRWVCDILAPRGYRCKIILHYNAAPPLSDECNRRAVCPGGGG